ncbi:MAG: GGDEF domain-containing protein [Acidimicrobiales bacterium]|nr:GGDEF domain-containing protein [Acidimicrobiales bacterium]
MARTGAENEISEARGAVQDAARSSLFMVMAQFMVVATVSSLVASLLVASHQPWLSLLSGAIGLALCAPGCLYLLHKTQRVVGASDAVADARQARLNDESRRRDFEAQVADAFEMAEDETEALSVAERALRAVLPDRSVELLLADNSHAHLTRMATSSPDGEAPGCPVGSPQECPAARRARAHQFNDSEAVNACPKMRDRANGRCSGVCVPVAMMGRTVGVIHTVGPVGEILEDATVERLQVIANNSGSRLGVLRIMAETQLQASTDGLTGLLNRRALENEFRRRRRPDQVTTVVMCDLDHFKMLNDTYGHETGDRALRLFAETLKGCVRPQDIPSRYGGEEFVIVFPGCGPDDANWALERVRGQLAVAIREAGVPPFTASFGLVEAEPKEDFASVLRRADAALFVAKRAGRDRVHVQLRPSDDPLVDAVMPTDSAPLAGPT